MISDAAMRGKRGEPTEANPLFLDPSATLDHFVQPAIEGLGDHAGPLVFQLSPLPGEMKQRRWRHRVIEQHRRAAGGVAGAHRQRRARLCRRAA